MACTDKVILRASLASIDDAAHGSAAVGRQASTL